MLLTTLIALTVWKLWIHYDEAVKGLIDRAPGRGVGTGILSSVGCSIKLPQSAE